VKVPIGFKDDKPRNTAPNYELVEGKTGIVRRKSSAVLRKDIPDSDSDSDEYSDEKMTIK